MMAWICAVTTEGLGMRKLLLIKIALHLACGLPLLYLTVAVQSGAAGGSWARDSASTLS